jgi:hypothetical protein
VPVANYGELLESWRSTATQQVGTRASPEESAGQSCDPPLGQPTLQALGHRITRGIVENPSGEELATTGAGYPIGSVPQ